MPYPDLVVAVVGTGTGVGKTWTTSAVAQVFRASGVRVAARKPAQSFDSGEGLTDAEVLAAATGEDPFAVCLPHRWYEKGLAPPMAAEALGLRVPSIADLVTEISWPEGVAVGFVEGAGGVASPLGSDGDNALLVATIRAQVVVLVAHAELGTINDVRLAVRALPSIPTIVMLNRFDEDNDTHRRNRSWLSDRERFQVLTSPADLFDLLLSRILC